MVVRITSPSNPTLKQLRALKDKKARRETGLFLAEGLRICTEALEAGHVPAVLVFAGEAAPHPLVAALVVAAEAAGGQAIETDRDMLHKLTGKDNPQGVVGAFRMWPTGLARLERHLAPLWLVVENLKDPGNLGTMLRTCDATGAGGVILLDQSVDPFGIEAVRASMGALFTRQVAQAGGAEFFAWLRDGPGLLVGAALENARDYRDIDWAAPTFLFMGNEQSGLPTAYAAQCDTLARLPMRGKADSLNVAVAAAVLLYEALFRLDG